MSEHFEKQQGRRAFLARPAQLAAVSLLTGQARAVAPPILTRQLGKTGLRLPIVSMGVMNADVPGLVRRSYELGIRHFDTAAVYQGGRNEEMVGAVIGELGVRDKVVIATKVLLRGSQATSPQAKSSFRQVFEGSLRRLKMDYVDILYYHSVDTKEGVTAEGPIEALAELKKEGKIRFTGISTHRGGEILPEAVKAGVYDVGLVTINYTMADDKALLSAIDGAAKAGMGLVAMKTQAGGGRAPGAVATGELPPHSQTALLKWVLKNPAFCTAIPGFTTYPQLEMDFTVASNLDFTADEQSYLADRKTQARAEFCRQCGECRGDCPQNVAIPDLMRSHMYAFQYANFDQAHRTLAQMEPARGLAACQSCESCQAQCRHTVPIGQRIERLKSFAV